MLAIAQNLDLMHQLDAAFLRVGEVHGGLLVKFHGSEKVSEDELRARLEHDGVEVGRLKEEGCLLMRPERSPSSGRRSELKRLFEEVGDGRTVWATFDRATQVDLETALKGQEELVKLVEIRQLVIKTAVLESAIDEWPSAALRWAQTSHSGTIWASKIGLSLCHRRRRRRPEAGDARSKVLTAGAGDEEALPVFS